MIAVVDLDQEVDAAEQGRLARTGCPDQGDRLMLTERKIDSTEHLPITEGLGHSLNIDDRFLTHELICSRAVM